MIRISERTPTWRPVGSRPQWHTRPPVGLIIALDRQPWRVVETREINPANWTEAERSAYVAQYPANDTAAVPPQEWPLRPWVLVLDPLPTGKRHHARCPAGRAKRRFDVLDEHYPVCNVCRELVPCRHMTTEQEVEAGQAKLDRLTSLTTESCWGCSEPITRRQRSIGFEGDNLLLPGGPSPVRFHTRKACYWTASDYEKAWIAADPSRPWRLYCPGDLVRHMDGPACSEGDRCAGATVYHRSTEDHTSGHIQCDHCSAVQQTLFEA